MLFQGYSSGPWELKREKDGTRVYSPAGPIAEMLSGSQGMRDQNGKLIAAAPALLAENERLRTELSAMTRAMNSQREITIEIEKERSAAAANIRRLVAALWEIDGLHDEPLSWNIASAALAGGRGEK